MGKMLSSAVIVIKTIKAIVKPLLLSVFGSKKWYGRILFMTLAVDENGHIEHQSLPVKSIRRGISGHQICHIIIIPGLSVESAFLLIKEITRKQKIEKIKICNRKG